MSFTHKRCGRPVTVLLGGYALASPTLGISNGKIIPSIVEIVETNKPQKFLCTKCDEVYDTEESVGENILTLCDLCQKEFPLNEIYTSTYVSKVCHSCVNGEGGNASGTKKQRELALTYDVLPKNLLSSAESVLSLMFKKGDK